MHAPDCALTLYSHLDPATLKAPLACDCEESDGPTGTDVAEPEDRDAYGPMTPIASIRPAVTGPTVTLTGDAARAYKLLATAETALKAAQKRRDEALRAFLEAVTG